MDGRVLSGVKSPNNDSFFDNTGSHDMSGRRKAFEQYEQEYLDFTDQDVDVASPKCFAPFRGSR